MNSNIDHLVHYFLSVYTLILMMTMNCELNLAQFTPKKVATNISDCNPRAQQRVDTNFARIMTIGTYRKFPENVGHMRRYCQENMDMLNVVRNYTDRCLDHLAKQVSSVFIYTVEKNMFEAVCKKETKLRKDLFRASTCANTGATEFVNCHQHLIDSMVALKAVTDDRFKIPFVCCQYWKVRACIVQSGKRIDDCDNKKIDTILKIEHSLTDNVLDLICGGYEEGTDKCQRLGEPPKKQAHHKRTKSFLFPIIDMLKGYPRIQG